MIEDIINNEALCFSFIPAFLVFYITNWLQTKELPEYAGRKISTKHCYLSIFLIFVGFPAKIIAYNSIIYWLIDSVMMFTKQKFDKKMFVHHLISSTSTYLSYTDYPEVMKLALLSEISTIFLNNCWFMYKDGKTSGTSFIWNSRLLLASFFVFRVLNFTWIIYNFYNHQLSMFFIPIWLMNLYWFVLLFQSAIKYKIFE